MKSSAINALFRIGDLLYPEFEDFPRFSDHVPLELAITLIKTIPEHQQKELETALKYLNLLPNRLLKLVLSAVYNDQYWPRPVRHLSRQLHTGLKSVTGALYYADPPAAIEFVINNPLPVDRLTDSPPPDKGKSQQHHSTISDRDRTTEKDCT